MTSSYARLYESPERTPLAHVAQPQEITWMGSILFLSAAMASLVFGPISYKIGPKSVLLLCGLLQMVRSIKNILFLKYSILSNFFPKASWFCVHFASDMLHIYSSRVCAGIAGGAAYTVLPLYISEIAEGPAAKASLNVSVEIWRACGIFIGFIFGSYLNYDYVAVVGILISFFFSMVFPFVQESPYYFLRKGNMAGLEKSLRWFRGIRSIDDRNNPEFDHELAQIKNSLHEKTQLIESGPSASQLVKILFGDLVLAVASQLGGIFTILSYGSIISNSATPLKLTGDILVLIFAVVHLLATLVAKAFSGCVNRRVRITTGNVFVIILHLNFCRCC